MNQRAVAPLMALSFSRLTTFEQCAAKFEHLYVRKTVKDTDNEFTLYGTRVHEGLEKYGRALVGTVTDEAIVALEEDEFPPEVRPWLRLVKLITQRPGEKHFEKQVAIRRDLTPCDWFAPDVWIRGVLDVLVLDGTRAFVVDWKGLPLDTPLPTPSGWTTMGEVKVGDMLFAENGDQCTVIGKSEVKNIRCFEIVFDDTSHVVCDENHLWKLDDGHVVPVQELQRKDHIAVATALALPNAELPIDPYVLGLWLADGKHTSGEICKPDTFIWEEIQRRGYELGAYAGDKNRCRAHTVKGIRGVLDALGLLRNKHVPQKYLRAGYQQRLDLLRGLMDGDGSANPTREQAIFTSTSKQLSDGVMELLASLGQRPLQNTVLAHGFGKEVTAYPISFRPIGINPFLLPRKADRVLPSWGVGRSTTRRVLSVTEIPSVPTQCIAVDSSDHTFLCTKRMIPTHNTGKVKENPTQLQLFAALVFAHFPEVEEVKTMFVWLAHDQTSDAVYQRKRLHHIWNALTPRFARVQEAVELGVFKAHPSGLCRWCPARGVCAEAR